MVCDLVKLRGVVLCSLWSLSIAQAQGYRVEPGRVVVEGTDWQGWAVAPGTVQVSTEGVKPQFIRDRTNAALDAPSFGGGIWKAGTRQEQAAQILDGQEDTYWEPDPSAPLEDWWVEIDLGRLVWVQQVVVKFVAEDGGNPFLAFKVLSSPSVAGPQHAVLNYTTAGRSEEAERIPQGFTFKLRSAARADPGFSGDLVQILRIAFTARDEGRRTEVSERQWEALPEVERGAVLYFRRLASGVLQEVDRASYEALSDPERRGPVRYYHRRRTRLSEVEVWSAGDNITLGVQGRGGQITGPFDDLSGVLTVDGDYSTFWALQIGRNPSLTEEEDVTTEPAREILLDLGTWYWLDRILLVFFDYGFPNYTLQFSDGNRTADHRLIYTSPVARGTTGEEEARNLLLLYQDNPFPLTKARYVKVAYRLSKHATWSGIKELLLYGAGFLPQASLTSKFIELGQAPRVLSSLAWEADIPSGAQLEIRTRTGDQLVQQVHYFNKSGGEVSQAQYRNLLSFLRGDSVAALVPGPDWSNWSPVYLASGAPITSPSPRRYVQVQASLLSDDPEQAVLLRRLSIQLKTVLATQVLGEILPGTVPQAGQPQEVVLYLRPFFQAGHTGFDQVRVEIPPGAQVELNEVVVGTEEEVAAGGGRVYGGEELGRIPTGPDSLWVRLPEPITPSAQGVVALRFSGVFYLASNAFRVWVGQGEGEERVWQLVEAGDATTLGRGQGLTVFTPFEPDFLGAVEASSNLFTPNGDGINDQVVFTVPAYKILGDKVLVLEVYSLDGKRVRRVEQWAAPAVGVHQLAWDGRDQEGRLAPPGLYLCRVGFAVDAQNVDQPRVTRTVASVY